MESFVYFWVTHQHLLLCPPHLCSLVVPVIFFFFFPSSGESNFFFSSVAHKPCGLLEEVEVAPYLLNRHWRLICSSYHVKNYAGIIEYCVMVHNLDGNQVFLIK